MCRGKKKMSGMSVQYKGWHEAHLMLQVRQGPTGFGIWRWAAGIA